MPKEKDQLSSYLSGTGVNKRERQNGGMEEAVKALSFKAHTLAGYSSAHL